MVAGPADGAGATVEATVPHPCDHSSAGSAASWDTGAP